MPNGTRTLVVVLALVVGLGVGWLIGHGQTPPAPPPAPTPVPTVPVPTPVPTVRPFVTPPGPYPHAKNWNLIVGPNPCDVTENGQPVPVAVISKRGNHSIRYQSNNGQDLGIVFHVPPGTPQPFKNVGLAGYDPQGYAQWALVCDPSQKWCTTGPADKRIIDDTYIKTDQILNRKPCDAGIIIER